MEQIARRSPHQVVTVLQHLSGSENHSSAMEIRMVCTSRVSAPCCSALGRVTEAAL